MTTATNITASKKIYMADQSHNVVDGLPCSWAVVFETAQSCVAIFYNAQMRATIVQKVIITKRSLGSLLFDGNIIEKVDIETVYEGFINDYSLSQHDRIFRVVEKDLFGNDVTYEQNSNIYGGYVLAFDKKRGYYLADLKGKKAVWEQPKSITDNMPVFLKNPYQVAGWGKGTTGRPRCKLYETLGFSVKLSTYGNATHINDVRILSITAHGAEYESTDYKLDRAAIEGMGLTFGKTITSKTIAVTKEGYEYCDLRGDDDSPAEEIYIDIK